jgi:iron complex outermembrane recepter protein
MSLQLMVRAAGSSFALLLALGLPAAPLSASRTDLPPLAPPIIGTVVDSAGAPLENVQVVATELQRVVITDGEGKFKLVGAPVGTVHLTIVHVGYAPVHEIVTVPATGDAVRVRIVMRRTALRLAGVQITASPTGTDPLSVTQSTIQLSGKDLQRQLGTSVAQTLSSEPGMAMRFNGPMANVPVIRGLTGERILTLQDGERVADLSSAAADHAVIADPNSAERIEVIRGPASLLYGNSAVGGVVNVISGDIPTSVPSRIGGFVNGQSESVTPGGVASGALNIPLGQSFAATLRGSFRDQSSYRIGGGAAQANTDARTWNGTAGLGYVGSTVTAGVVYRQSDFNYGIPFGAGGEEIRIDGVRRGLQARAGITTGKRNISYVRVEGTAQWYQHSELDAVTGDVGTRFRLKAQTASVTAKTQFGPVSGSIGAQAFLRQYEPIGDEAFTPAANSTNLAAYIYQELPLTTGASESRTPRLQFGGRMDTYELAAKAGSDPRFAVARSRRFNQASGSLGASLPFADHFTLSGSASRAFRAPTVEELYANGYHVAVGTFDIGNALLNPETSTGLDVVLRAQGGTSFMQVSAYRNAIDDYILPVALGATVLVDGEPVPSVVIEQRNAVLTGFEFSGETQIGRHVVIGGLADAVRGTVQGGNNLPFIPAARLGGSLRYDGGAWSIGGDGRRVLKQTRVAADNERDTPTDSYTVLNLSASWTIPSRRLSQTLTARVDNLLDERFADATSRIKSFTFNPGRNVSLVYRVGF